MLVVAPAVVRRSSVVVPIVVAVVVPVVVAVVVADGNDTVRAGSDSMPLAAA